jgi:hypothetical protein
MSKKNKSQTKGFGAPKETKESYEIFVKTCDGMMNMFLKSPDALSTVIDDDGNCLSLAQLSPVRDRKARLQGYETRFSSTEINRSELLGDTNRFVPLFFERYTKAGFGLSDIDKYVTPALYDPDTHSFYYCKDLLINGVECTRYVSVTSGSGEPEVDAVKPLLKKLRALYTYRTIVANPDSDTLSLLERLQGHFALSDKDMDVFQEVYSQSVN